MERLKQNKGITLIALVITIIVLLILAGVTINLTLGENGIFTTAQKAAKNYTNAQEKELADINDFTNTVDQTIQNISGENGGTSTEGGASTGGENPPTNSTVVSQITASDYGKSINYSVTVKNRSNEDVTLTDWKVFYNNGTNIYIILSDYLNNSLIPEETGMTTSGTYNAYWNGVGNGMAAAETLSNTSYWSAFAGGRGGSSATGGPTANMLMASYNEKHNTSLAYNGAPELGITDSLYVNAQYDECSGYWSTTPDGSSLNVWAISCNEGTVSNYYYGSYIFGVRPVVCLTSGITGTVGDVVTID